jgi:hypothetical protein
MDRGAGGVSKLDIDNFMGVIQATQQTEDGLVFPGEYMISGKPVTAPGATLAHLMSDRGIAEQWFQSIKDTYEREKDERDNPRSEETAPDLVIRGADADAGDREGGGSPATVPPAAVEEELPEAATLEEILELRMDGWKREIDRLRPELAVAEQEYAKAVAAWEAINGL